MATEASAMPRRYHSRKTPRSGAAKLNEAGEILAKAGVKHWMLHWF